MLHDAREHALVVATDVTDMGMEWLLLPLLLHIQDSSALGILRDITQLGVVDFSLHGSCSDVPSTLTLVRVQGFRT